MTLAVAIPVVCGVLYLLWYLHANLRWKGEPPVVTGYTPFLGVAAEFGKDMVKFSKKTQKVHGDVFTLYVAGKRMTFVLNPLDFPTILKQRKNLVFNEISRDVGAKAFKYDSDAIERPEFADPIHKFYKQYLQGGEHVSILTQRMQPRLEPVVKTALQDEGGKKDLFLFVRQTMFAAALETIFGTPFKDPEAVRKDFEAFDNQFNLLCAGVPDFMVRESVEALDRLADCFEKQPERKDMSVFMAKREELFQSKYGIFKKNHAARAQCAMLWALQANTVPASFWAVAYIFRNPELVKLLRLDLQATIRKKKDYDHWEVGDPIPILTKSDLDEQVRMQSCIQEAIRLSASSMTVRKVLQPTTLTFAGDQKWTLRKGDMVVIPGAYVHANPNIHPKPEEFVWDRFLEDGKADEPKLKSTFNNNDTKLSRNLAFIPFGGGVSMCPGRFFAATEIKLLLSVLLGGYNLEIHEKPPQVSQSRAGAGILHPSLDGKEAKCTFSAKKVTHDQIRF
eukprot:CAMPEP_0170187192 /NCGR_PEP_ID=MMETSP0040_2-20121228/41143_1 /TAXON_ID=641309 /ORGANISM="Lotharella oceanica, Strain CCMP622" /LENGTH=506 /DNA_ID=CAMNT_0010434177 /DNA_START=39 /DNA_END=1560 /DNA_ORIENTATION=-